MTQSRNFAKKVPLVQAESVSEEKSKYLDLVKIDPKAAQKLKAEMTSKEQAVLR